MMKKLFISISIAIVALLFICFASTGCSTTLKEWPAYGDVIANPVSAQGIDDVGSPLDITPPNQNITLKNPTYQEMIDFLAQDLTSEKQYVAGVFECRHFSTEVDNNANAAGWQCGFVLVCYPNSQHSVVAFNTTDRGLIFVEPQTDDVIDVMVGGTYQSLAIVEILIAW